MDEIAQAQLKQRFLDATQSFIDKIKDDPNVIAVIVCGSLAYDVVWEKSDIDMTLIVRDQVLKQTSYCIDEDGITINVSIMVRSAFKRGMEKMIGGSFPQAYFSKGKIFYTTDDSLYEYFEDIKKIGGDDIALSMMTLASYLISNREKGTKWLTVRKDPVYAQYYLLLAAEIISAMELCLKGEPASRESIQKALKINPDAITPFYHDAMSHPMSEAEIAKRLELIDSILERHLDIIKQPIVEFLWDQQIKTVTLISKYFRVEGALIIMVLDYLAEKGVIQRVSQTIRVTPKSRMAVEEIGYLYVP